MNKFHLPLSKQQECSIQLIHWHELIYWIVQFSQKFWNTIKKHTKFDFFTEKQIPRSIKIQYNGEVYLNILELRENINIFQGSFPECNFIVQRLLT